MGVQMEDLLKNLILMKGWWIEGLSISLHINFPCNYYYTYRE
jgi:hypothetical protein